MKELSSVPAIRSHHLRKLSTLLSILSTLLLPYSVLGQTVAFKPIEDFPTENPGSLSIGDLNRDGILDIAVVDFDTKVSVLLGRPSGAFAAPSYFNVGNTPRSVAMGDLNKDGMLDLAVANDDSNSVSVLLGDGNGSFGDPNDFDVGFSPFSLSVGDLDQDGNPDLAVANVDSDQVSILLGDGTGVFGTASNFDAGSQPVSVFIEDVDEDGDLDLVVANFDSDEINILEKRGGLFSSPISYAVGAGPFSVVVGDFNRDGIHDFATANWWGKSVSILMMKTVLVCDLKCQEEPALDYATEIPIGSGARSLAIADFDGDGNQDLATAKPGAQTASVLVGRGDGSFEDPIDFTVEGKPQFLAAADLDRDGKPDLAVANAAHESVSVLLNDTAFAPTGYTEITEFATLADCPYSIDTGDFNRDGNPDLAVVNSGCHGDGTGDVSILLGDGLGSFGGPVSFPVYGGFPVSVSVGDFNRDGKQDLAIALNWIHRISILLGFGTGSFGVATTFQVGSQPVTIAQGDFNQDGITDLVTANHWGSVSVLLGVGDGTFGPRTDFDVGTSARYLAVGDFNRDGKEDLAVSDRFHGFTVMMGNGTGGFGTAASYTVETDIMRALHTADFNRDGILDILVPGAELTTFIGGGDGSFTPQQTSQTWVPRSLLDFNRDGILDFVSLTSGASGPYRYRLYTGIGDGNFEPSSSRPCFDIGPPGLHDPLERFTLLVADLDKDGRPDIATSHGGMEQGKVSILFGKEFPEVCDGCDNDLDNQVDEGFPDTDDDDAANCVDDDDDNDGFSDEDEISAGSDPLNPMSVPEVCGDGVDNDLDGETDEGFPDTDGDLLLDCIDPDDDADGFSDDEELSAGSDPLNPLSVPEVCDGLDNDLDGQADEDFDMDLDGIGDCVDPCPIDTHNDIDGDGLCSNEDNCDWIHNPQQSDVDNDGIGDKCSVDLTVSRVEITQAIQNYSNSIPLVAGKRTYVRVYVDIGLAEGAFRGGDITDLTAHIQITDWQGNQVYPFAGQYVWPEPKFNTVPKNPQPADANHTLNFVLPPEWTSRGVRYLKVTLNPHFTTFDRVFELDYDNNEFGPVYMNFHQRNYLYLYFVPVRAKKGSTYCSYPDVYDYYDTLQWVYKTYPIELVYSWKKSKLKYDKDPTQSPDGLTRKLWWKAFWARWSSLPDSKWFGLVCKQEDFYTSGTVGQAFTWGSEAWGARTNITTSYGFQHTRGGQIMAHELGHLFGRNHAPCGNPDDPDNNYPQYGNLPRTSIGDYGFDGRYAYDPSYMNDMMSYCDPQWISPYTYIGLYNEIGCSYAPDICQ